MDGAPDTASPWEHGLQHSLDGSFTARRRGLLTAEFALLGSGDERFGRLHLCGFSVARFEYEGRAATLKWSGGRYRMVAEGEEVLAAAPKGRSLDELEIPCNGRTYEANASFFRNFALASYREGGERAVRVSGSLTGRSYEAVFDTEDACAFPVGIFLLWHLAANRRRAYRMGGPARGGEI